MTTATQDSKVRGPDAARDFRESRERVWAEYIYGRGSRYANCRLDNFEATEDKQRAALKLLDMNPAEYIKHNLIWLGTKGTGKDHLMTGAIFRAIAATKIPFEKFGEQSARAITVKWTCGVELFGDRRDAMQESEREFVSPYIRADLLAISDPIPPVGTLTEFQMQTLYRIVDARYNRSLPTWMTINVAKRKDAQDRLGGQIVDRLRENAIVIECFWDSFRKTAEL